MENQTIHTPPTPAQTFLGVAHSIGIQLSRDAIWYKNRCNWLGHNVEVMDNKYQAVMQTFGSNYYNGLSGVAFFLAKILGQTQDGIILHTLNGTINNILKLVDEEEFASQFGVYSGKMGVAYTLIELGETLQRPYLIEKGLDVLKQISKEEIQDFEIDVIAGAAGSIPALLGVYKKHPKQKYLLDLATKCGDFLLEKAIKDKRGWSWLAVGSKVGLTGYSHGTAGIAISFLELFEATNEKRFHEAAFQSFAYESSWYDDSNKNWPDLRINDGSEGKPLEFITAWCHGAPGIALSRIKAYQLTGNESFKKEALIALETTYNQLSAQLQNNQSVANYSLCHGIAGNADILLSGGLAFDEPKYIEIAEKVGYKGIELYENSGTEWPSGVTDPTGTSAGQEYAPGLMLGTAGTAYFYMRLAAPHLFKSALFLESSDTLNTTEEKETNKAEMAL